MNTMKHFKIACCMLILVAVCWFCLFAVGAFRLRGKNYVLGNNISLIINENLKKHDSKENVIKFLDAHQLQDRESVAGSAALKEHSLAEELGEELQGIGSAIIVLIPEVESSLRSRYYVTVVFYFDKQQNMIDFKTRKMGIGL